TLADIWSEDRFGGVTSDEVHANSMQTYNIYTDTGVIEFAAKPSPSKLASARPQLAMLRPLCQAPLMSASSLLPSTKLISNT
ncbi:MAG: hypothetical protein Q9181_008073, partial [Wetmoreana brouardii]